MAYEESLKTVSFDADASIGIFTGIPGMPGSLHPNSGMQFRWVKITGPGTVGLVGVGATENNIGCLQNKPQNVGDAAAVAISGITMAECGGPVVAGDSVKTDATSRVVTGIHGTDHIAGVAVLSGAIGELIPVLEQVN